MAKKIIAYDDGRFIGLDVAALPENTTPAAGDWLVSQNPSGDLEKVDVGNLPGGASDSLGTGFSGGGGSGTVPENTVAETGLLGGHRARLLFNEPSYKETLGDGFKSFGIETFIPSEKYSFFGMTESDGNLLLLCGNLTLGQESSILFASEGSILLSGRTIVNNDYGDGSINLGGTGAFKVIDSRTVKNGIEYDSDNSETLKTNDRSIPDVGTVKKVSRPYQYYDFLINQVGTDDPVPTIFENTIGEIVWTRVSEGTYLGTLSGTFINDKTWYTPKFSHDPISGKAIIIQAAESTNAIEARTYLSGTLSDSVLVNFPIEIRIYP